MYKNVQIHQKNIVKSILSLFYVINYRCNNNTPITKFLIIIKYNDKYTIFRKIDYMILNLDIDYNKINYKKLI